MNAVSKTIGIALLATTVVVATVSALILAVDFVFLIFLGVLFGIFLTKTSILVRDRTPLNYGWSLGAITSLLVLILFGTIIVFGVNIEDQLDKTSKQLDKSSEKIHQWLNQHPLAFNAVKKIPFASEVFESIDASGPEEKKLGQHLTEKIVNADDVGESKPPNGQQANRINKSPSTKSADNSPPPEKRDESSSQMDLSPQAQLMDEQNGQSEMVRSAAGKAFAVFGKLLSTTLGAVANIGIIFFMGIFIAVNPTHYRDGVVYLFPQDKRARVTEVMNKVGNAMFNWLNGRFFAMLITGIGTWIALLILGVPMAFTVGVITGLLTFIPNIGGIIALALASLLALTQGPVIVVWVVVFYSALQLIESNIITPLVQQHQTSIPPALLIGFQILMGALTGFLGIMVATPLLAGLMVVVKQIWIKDTLDDESFEDHDDSDHSAENGPQFEQTPEENDIELVRT